MNELLLEFDNPGSPCAVFQPRSDSVILGRIRESVALGLLRSVDGVIAATDPQLWLECLVLTHEGRIACGLKVAVAKVCERPQRSLFDEP